MWRRRISKAFLQKGGRAAHWANLHHRAVIAGMFCVMACGIVWLVAGRGEAQGRFDETARLLYSGFHEERQARPVTAEILELMRLYGEVQAIHPDSLTVRDSTFLKGIDQHLNRILHE